MCIRDRDYNAMAAAYRSDVEETVLAGETAQLAVGKRRVSGDFHAEEQQFPVAEFRP